MIQDNMTQKEVKVYRVSLDVYLKGENTPEVAELIAWIISDFPHVIREVVLTGKRLILQEI